MSILLFLFPQAIMSIFTPDQQVRDLGATLLRIVSLSEPFFAAVIIFEGVFNGVGYTKIPFLYSVFSMWGIRILFSFLCVHVFNLGLTAVWVCMILDNVIRCILFAVHYVRGRWKRKIGLDAPGAPIKET